MVRSVLTVLVGFLVIMVLISIAVAVHMQLAGTTYNEDVATTGNVIVNLVYGAVIAVIGGYVTARIATSDPKRHVTLLAGLMLVMGVITLMAGTQPQQPDWYQPVLTVLGPAGVIVGGRLHARSAVETYDQG